MSAKRYILLTNIEGAGRMAVGVVRTFDDEAGYGFIETDEGEHLFVHHSSIEMEGFRTLSPGAKVIFEITIGKRGPEAVKVRKI